MTNQASIAEEKPVETVNPQQFRLLDLFALMTLAAVVSAMAAPFLLGLDSEYRLRLLAVIGFQFLIVLWSIFHYARKRKRLLDEAGSKIGFGFCGQLRWRHWPIARSVLGIFFTLLWQLGIAVKISSDLWFHGELNGPVGVSIDMLPVSHRVMHYLYYFSFLDYLLYLGVSWGVGHSFSICRWRAYPGAIEFFSNGIVQRGTLFIPWERVEVRPSSLFADKIAVVVRGGQNSIVGTTIMAQVTSPLRERVFEAANASESA